MNEHFEVFFSIGDYEDQVVCDVIPMDGFHHSLEDRSGMTSESFTMGDHTYSKNGKKFSLGPIF